jgi:hypothetical protein
LQIKHYFYKTPLSILKKLNFYTENGYNLLGMCKAYASNEQFAWNKLPAIECFALCNSTSCHYPLTFSEIQKIQTTLERTTTTNRARLKWVLNNIPPASDRKIS